MTESNGAALPGVKEPDFPPAVLQSQGSRLTERLILYLQLFEEGIVLTTAPVQLKLCVCKFGFRKVGIAEGDEHMAIVLSMGTGPGESPWLGLLCLVFPEPSVQGTGSLEQFPALPCPVLGKCMNACSCPVGKADLGPCLPPAQLCHQKPFLFPSLHQ